MTTISVQDIENLLQEVKDPEVPVLNIAELGVLRDVAIKKEKVVITITPTYSGCPAMRAIEDEIQKVLHDNQIENFEIKTVYAPAWTTDWMSDEAKNKLKEYGIAPPGKTTSENIATILSKKNKSARCPYCNSPDTKLTSIFGSTACKALHYCNNCNQPFEEFKCH